MKQNTILCAAFLGLLLPIAASATTQKVLNKAHLSAAVKDAKLAEHPKILRALHKAKGAEAVLSSNGEINITNGNMAADLIY